MKPLERPRVVSVNLKHRGRGWSFHCPGCGAIHVIDERWSFNGDVAHPTFDPSLLVQGPNLPRCHSFIRDGMIQYLDDCEHHLAGSTVPIPYVEEAK